MKLLATFENLSKESNNEHYLLKTFEHFAEFLQS